MNSPGAARRRRLIALITLLAACIGGAAGWWVGGTRSTGYVATAAVVINPIPGNTFWDDSVSDPVTLETEAEEARSDAVLAAVAEKSGLISDVNVLRRRISVSTVPGSQVIRLSYRGGSESDAEAVATTLADTALHKRLERAEAAHQAQVVTVHKAINQVNLELSNSNSRASERVLTQRRVVLRGQLRGLEQKSLDPGAVLGVTSQSASRRTMRIGLAGVGAVVGALGGLWLARRVGRMRPSGPTIA